MSKERHLTPGVVLFYLVMFIVLFTFGIYREGKIWGWW